MPSNTLGEQLKKARLFKGYLLKEMVMELGVDEKTLRSWENNVREPAIDNMKKLEMLMKYDQ